MEESTRQLYLGAVIAAGLMLSAASAQGVDPYIGTWKLNLEKSTSTRLLPKSRTATWAAEGQNLTVTIEGVEANGQLAKLILWQVYDGMPHPATGSPDFDTTIYYRIGNSINSVWFKNGKVVQLNQVQVAPGKTFTIIVEGIDANGQSYCDVGVWDRQ
jgi:hypothetical protein